MINHNTNTSYLYFSLGYEGVTSAVSPLTFHLSP